VAVPDARIVARIIARHFGPEIPRGSITGTRKPTRTVRHRDWLATPPDTAGWPKPSPRCGAARINVLRLGGIPWLLAHDIGRPYSSWRIIRETGPFV